MWKIIKKYSGYLFIKRRLLNNRKIEGYTYKKLLELLETSYTKDSKDISEKYLIHNIIGLRDKRANDIMIPRVEIVAMEDNLDISDMIKNAHDSGFSRFPVFKDNLDNVVGFIHVKDLIYFLKNNLEIDLSGIIRQVLFISPYMKLFDLLYEMKLKSTHMALVVDEFGGVDGLITIEDVVEEIVGEIRDEHDRAPSNLIKKQKAGLIEATGRIELEELEKYTGKFVTEEEKDEFNTLSGLIISLLGYIPSKNELVVHSSGVEFRVISVDPIKINKVIVDYAKLIKK